MPVQECCQTKMALLRKRVIPYLLGLALYFVALLLFSSSTFPGIWAYYKEDENAEEPEGRSVWSFHFQVCLGGPERKAWHCDAFSMNYGNGKARSVTLRGFGRGLGEG